MGDSDDSYDFSKLDLFVKELRAGADLVMGNRFLGGIEPGAMPWEKLVHLRPIFSGLGRFLFGSPYEGFSLRASGVFARRVPAHGFANDGHGVRLGNGDQSNFA